jgi:hypothetical protein
VAQSSAGGRAQQLVRREDRFVVLLTLCHGFARMTAGRMMRTGDQALYPRMELFVSGVWMSALAAIILAVLAFET